MVGQRCSTFDRTGPMVSGCRIIVAVCDAVAVVVAVAAAAAAAVAAAVVGNIAGFVRVYS